MSPHSAKPGLKRRSFLSLLPGAFAGAACLPLIVSSKSESQNYQASSPGKVCWLDVCAPFIVNDPEGVRSEIFLTSDTFSGAKGYEGGRDSTEYKIYLYDSAGQPIGKDGIAKHLIVPAMHTTSMNVRDLLGSDEKFWGGMRIRLRPSSREPMHASDLFSSAFVRWKTSNSFDNVHANPDPVQWQRPTAFFYSMPFPPLAQYEALFSLFNPNAEASAGSITVYDQLGAKLREASYELKPGASLLFDLRRGEFADDPHAIFSAAQEKTAHKSALLTRDGGTIAVSNRQGAQKSFAYLMLKRSGGVRFSVEHPIHQAPFRATPAPAPFDSAGRFKAKNILYTPLVFRAKQIGGVTLTSRFHFSSGAPLEEHLWLNPLITDPGGNVAWQSTDEAPPPSTISQKQIERGVIKLGGMQSCVFDCSELPLPAKFSGGLSLAVAPTTNHTLMKVEVAAKEWDAHAFTHFRPGLQSARGYQLPKQRGNLATDYIACGARYEQNGSRKVRDEVIGIINIDDKATIGHPTLEVFAAGGLLARIELGEVPAFGCRHYLLSDLSSGRIGPHDLTLRLVDERATLLMSVVHLDYVRRDLALDHGSDRFSTFNDYPCES
ncbi:MAG: hypothetical protein ACXW3C_00550 [Pyrinomonadaceae bacterium]